jgi:hypothetical protein
MHCYTHLARIKSTQRGAIERVREYATGNLPEDARWSNNAGYGEHAIPECNRMAHGMHVASCMRTTTRLYADPGAAGMRMLDANVHTAGYHERRLTVGTGI